MLNIQQHWHLKELQFALYKDQYFEVSGSLCEIQRIKASKRQRAGLFY